MSRTAEALFEDMPYPLQDELAFALEDQEGMAAACGESWNRDAPKRVFKDDGKGYAAPAHMLLKEHPFTWRVEIDGESFIWAHSTDTWCIVGEDL